MSNNSKGELSLGSLIQTLPVRSHTHIRPLVSKVTPTASSHGPVTGVSLNPAGTVAALRPPAEAKQKAARRRRRRRRKRRIRGYLTPLFTEGFDLSLKRGMYDFKR